MEGLTDGTCEDTIKGLTDGTCEGRYVENGGDIGVLVGPAVVGESCADSTGDVME